MTLAKNKSIHFSPICLFLENFDYWQFVKTKAVNLENLGFDFGQRTTHFFLFCFFPFFLFFFSSWTKYNLIQFICQTFFPLLFFSFFLFFFTQALWASPSAMKCEGPRHGKCFFYYRCDQSKIICWPTTTGQEIHKIFSLSICRYYPVKALWEVDIVTFNVNFPLILILLAT